MLVKRGLMINKTFQLHCKDKKTKAKRTSEKSNNIILSTDYLNQHVHTSYRKWMMALASFIGIIHPLTG